MLWWTLLKSNKEWVLAILVVVGISIYGIVKQNEGEEKALIRIEKKTQEAQKEIDNAKERLDGANINTSDRMRRGVF